MGRIQRDIDSIIAKLPKLKDGEEETCRSLLYDAVGEVAYEFSIQSGTVGGEVQVALHNLCLAIDKAIDADPELEAIFERPRAAKLKVV